MRVKQIEEHASARLSAEVERRRRADERAQDRLSRRMARLQRRSADVAIGAGAEGTWLELERAELVHAPASLLAWWLTRISNLLWGTSASTRLYVTPGGYWALTLGERVHDSGRVSELVMLHGRHAEDQYPRGPGWVYLHGPSGRLCQLDPLGDDALATALQFAHECGIRIQRVGRP